MKVVINKCYGGFGLSFTAMRKIAERKGFPLYFYDRTKYEYRDGIDEFVRVDSPGETSMSSFTLKQDLGPVISGKEALEGAEWFFDSYLERNDLDMIAVIEEMGKESFGDFAELEIVEIPDDVNWKIEEHDGIEWVAEVHLTWG